MGLPGPAARLLEDFSTFEDLPVAMSLLSCDGRLLRANAQMCRLVGRTEADLLGVDAAELVVAAHRPSLARELEALANAWVPACEREVVYRRPDGEDVRVHVRHTAVHDAHGTVAFVVEHAVAADADADGDGGALAAAWSRAAALMQLADRLDAADRDKAAVAQVAADALHELLGGGVTVFLLDPVEGLTVEAAAVRADDAGVEQELRGLYAQSALPVDSGLMARACASPGPLVVHEPFGDGPAANGACPLWPPAHRVHAVLLVPLRWEGRLLGVLTAGRHVAAPFDEDDLAYAGQVAHAVSTALADAQLLALERSTARRERAVARVSRRCDEALGQPGGVLEAAVRAVAEELGGPCAALLLSDVGGRAHVDAAAVAHPDPVVQQVLQAWLPTCVDEEAEVIPRVFAEGSIHVVGRSEVVALTGALPALQGHADDVAVESLYAVRLVARGQIVGLLGVGSATRRFTVEDRRLVDALADRVALALDNAELLDAARSTRSQARALVEHCSDLLLMAGRDGAVTYGSPASTRLFGRRLGEPLLPLVVPQDRRAAVRAWRQVLRRPGPSAPVDLRVVDGEGRERLLSAVANNLLDDPSVGGVVLTVRDVTEERAATARLAERAGQQAALAAIGATALTAELDELHAFVAKSIADTLDSTTAGVLRRLDDDRWLVLGGSHQAYVGTCVHAAPESSLAQVLRTRQPLLVDDDPADGARHAEEVVARHGLRSGAVAPVLVGGEVWGAVTAHSDQPRRFSAVDADFLQTVAAVVSGAVERMLMSEQVLAQATTDPLTGLPNRAVVLSRLNDVLLRGEPLALLLLDLDDFKDVNDALGHSAGDELLSQLGARLDEVVDDRGAVARLGGDEFAVVLVGAGTADAHALADDVARSVAEPFALPGIDVTLSASVGIALAPDHGTTAEPLLQAADMAMYRAKLERNHWAVYDAELDSRRAERLALLSELRVALSSGQLVLHYQPLVDLRTERVVEVEALLRWHHPERGLLLPEAFLPTAEQTELVHTVTRHVVRSAARQARAWRARGWTGTVAVNISPLALRQPELVSALRQELLRDVGALTVELTESAFADERAREAVDTFAAAGIRCSVDDFGTGWSSLAALRDLPVGRLKLDRAFNRDVHRDGRDAAIVGSVVAMAHAVGLDVVAEGVETCEVAQRLRELEVDVAQGWLYGRPQPASALRLP